MDSYRHKGLRIKLIQLLKEKGITNRAVLESINNVPRHLFLDKAFEEQAYLDKALPINDGQTISQPYTVAFQTQLLDPQPSDLILEIGTGSGYQAAVLSGLCKKIYSIERHESLCVQTQKKLQQIGFGSVRTKFGDGFLGWPRFAPFDKIIITAGASTIPQDLKTQLKVGGIMVIPFGSGQVKEMLKIEKIDAENYDITSHGSFKFVPFLEGIVKI